MKAKKQKDYFAEIEKLISISPKQVYIAFAIHCARDVIGNITDEKINKQVSDALLVVERFNRGFATQLEVEAAISAAHSAANTVNAAYSAAYAAISAAHSAASAAYSAANSAAHSAANSAAHAANAANSAAHAANAANAAHAANSAAKEIKMKEYYEVLVKMLRSLTKLEKIVYNIV